MGLKLSEHLVKGRTTGVVIKAHEYLDIHKGLNTNSPGLDSINVYLLSMWLVVEEPDFVDFDEKVIFEDKYSKTLSRRWSKGWQGIKYCNFQTSTSLRKIGRSFLTSFDFSDSSLPVWTLSLAIPLLNLGILLITLQCLSFVLGDIKVILNKLDIYCCHSHLLCTTVSALASFQHESHIP